MAKSEVIFKLEEKRYCCLCNSDMDKDENKEKQFFWAADCYVERYYCSQCSEIGESVMNEYIKKVNKLRANKDYYDPHDLVRLIENLHTKHNGSIRISFDNNYGYDETLVKSPILKDDKPIGVITNVTSEKVEGFIWERYMPIITQFDHKQNPISFEIVY